MAADDRVLGKQLDRFVTDIPGEVLAVAREPDVRRASDLCRCVEDVVESAIQRELAYVGGVVQINDDKLGASPRAAGSWAGQSAPGDHPRPRPSLVFRSLPVDDVRVLVAWPAFVSSGLR